MPTLADVLNGKVKSKEFHITEKGMSKLRGNGIGFPQEVTMRCADKKEHVVLVNKDGTITPSKVYFKIG